SGKLPVPVPVHVRINGATPEFSLDQTTWFVGIWWEAPRNSDLGLFINFVMEPSVTSVDCDLPLIYSGVAEQGTSLFQACAVPALPAGSCKETYTMSVNAGARRYDPKIIITPIPGDGD